MKPSNAPGFLTSIAVMWIGSSCAPLGQVFLLMLSRDTKRVFQTAGAQALFVFLLAAMFLDLAAALIPVISRPGAEHDWHLRSW
jgi:hypothetical protein